LKEGKELLQEQVRRCNMAFKEQLVKHEHEVFSCRCLCFSDRVWVGVGVGVLRKDEFADESLLFCRCAS
jgi:hypothetical protein